MYQFVLYVTNACNSDNMKICKFTKDILIIKIVI
jgi:hypothetical protein